MKPHLIKNKGTEDKLNNICEKADTNCYIIKDNDILSLTGHQLRKWKDKIETELKNRLIEEGIYKEQVNEQNILHITKAYNRGFKDGKKENKQ